MQERYFRPRHSGRRDGRTHQFGQYWQEDGGGCHVAGHSGHHRGDGGQCNNNQPLRQTLEAQEKLSDDGRQARCLQRGTAGLYKPRNLKFSD